MAIAATPHVMASFGWQYGCSGDKTNFQHYPGIAPCRDELAVVACSALKQKYRDMLSGYDRRQQHVNEVAFVSIHMGAAQSYSTVLYWLCSPLIVLKLLLPNSSSSACASLPSYTPCDMQHGMQVLLQPTKEILARRVTERAALGSHFMPASLLESQLALVETDPTAYTYGMSLTIHSLI